MRINNKVLDIYRPKNETLNDAFDRFVVKIHHQNRMYGHKTFVLTGTLENYTRQEATEIIEKLGGKVYAYWYCRVAP